MRIRTRLFLESVLFFLIGLYAVNTALASYSKLFVPTVGNFQARVRLVPRQVVTLSKGHCYSQVVCIRRDPVTNQVRIMTITNKEMDLIEKLSGKMTQKEMDRMMDEAFDMNEQTFLRVLTSKLESPSQVASNRRGYPE